MPALKSGTALKVGDLFGALKSAATLGFVVMYGGRAHRLELDDNATVGDLRRAVQERTRVRRSRQALAPADPAVAARPEVRLGLTIDATKLKALKLNQNCRMTLGGEADDADRDIFDPQASTAERERAQAAREEAARRSQSEPRRFRDLPQLERAQHYRDQGNEAFGAGFSQRAADLYTRAINAVGARAGRADGQLAEKCLSNRAACYLKLRRYAEAACDAQRATELNPSWAKPYNRLGQALLMLQRYDEAAEAYERGLAHCDEDQNESLSKGYASAVAKGGDAARAAERREKERKEAEARRAAFRDDGEDLGKYVSPHNNDGRRQQGFSLDNLGKRQQGSMQGGVIDGNNISSYAQAQRDPKMEREEKQRRKAERELTRHKWREHMGGDVELDETSCDLFNNVRGRCEGCDACEGYFAKLGFGHNDTSSFQCARCGCDLQSHVLIGKCCFFDSDDPKYRRHRCGAAGEIINPFSIPKEMRQLYNIDPEDGKVP